MDETPQETAAPSAPSNNNTLKIIGALVIIVVLAFAAWEFGLKNKMAGESQMTVSPTPSESGSMGVSPTAVMARYKDGTYSATGAYQNPASREEVQVSITIRDGVATATTFTGTPDNPTTVTMQNKFKAGFTQEVVGKSIDEINLTVVNGSSLAPKGFMDALTQIKTQAQV